MTFKEQFPTLFKIVIEQGHISSEPEEENWEFIVDYNDLEENCLDKQRVRETFEYFIPKEGDRISIPVEALKQKMQELGL